MKGGQEKWDGSLFGGCEPLKNGTNRLAGWAAGSVAPRKRSAEPRPGPGLILLVTNSFGWRPDPLNLAAGSSALYGSWAGLSSGGRRTLGMPAALFLLPPEPAVAQRVRRSKLLNRRALRPARHHVYRLHRGDSLRHCLLTPRQIPAGGARGRITHS